MAKKAAKKVAAKKVARTRVTDDDLIGDAPKKFATKQAKVKFSAGELNPKLREETDREAPADNGIPPYPPELASIEAGRKSPAVVKWYRENHPEAYKKLYGTTVG